MAAKIGSTAHDLAEAHEQDISDLNNKVDKLDDRITVLERQRGDSN